MSERLTAEREAALRVVAEKYWQNYESRCVQDALNEISALRAELTQVKEQIAELRTFNNRTWDELQKRGWASCNNTLGVRSLVAQSDWVSATKLTQCQAREEALREALEPDGIAEHHCDLQKTGFADCYLRDWIYGVGERGKYARGHSPDIGVIFAQAHSLFEHYDRMRAALRGKDGE